MNDTNPKPGPAELCHPAAVPLSEAERALFAAVHNLRVAAEVLGGRPELARLVNALATASSSTFHAVRGVRWTLNSPAEAATPKPDLEVTP